MFSKNNKDVDKKNAVAVPEALKTAAPSIISRNLRIVGDLQSDGEIHVDGTVEGDIRCKILLVGDSATIRGEIISTSVNVHGTVDGQIKSNSVNLAKSAHVTGDILHESLAIENGAFLEGHCKRMEPSTEVGAGKINLVVRGSESIAVPGPSGSTEPEPLLSPKTVATPG